MKCQQRFLGSEKTRGLHSIGLFDTRCMSDVRWMMVCAVVLSHTPRVACCYVCVGDASAVRFLANVHRFISSASIVTDRCVCSHIARRRLIIQTYSHAHTAPSYTRRHADADARDTRSSTRRSNEWTSLDPGTRHSITHTIDASYLILTIPSPLLLLFLLSLVFFLLFPSSFLFLRRSCSFICSS